MEKLKDIRFNLRFFNSADTFESVHSVDELEEKLRSNQIAFDDRMAYFFSGQLERWLKCHGERDRELMEKIRTIDVNAPNKEIFNSLFSALGFYFDEKEIDRMIVSYDFPSQLRVKSEEKTRTAECQINSIRNEIDAYEAICRQLIEVKTDWVAVRKLVSKFVVRYFPILSLDVLRFFQVMKNPRKGCPQAVLALLADSRGRTLFDL